MVVIMLYLKDPKTKALSFSLTLVWIVFWVGIVKFFVSGITIFGVQMPTFSAGDFGVLMMPFLSLYFGRKYTDNNSKPGDSNDK
jgi:hypothetical protein